MENQQQQLSALKNLKAQLLKKSYDLIEELKSLETAEHRQLLLLPTGIDSRSMSERNPSHEYQENFSKLSGQVCGIKFENVQKKWLTDNTYRYMAVGSSKAIEFDVELVVDSKNLDDFEISSITCQFIKIPQYIMLEIQVWIDTITKTNNFSLFTSVISRYAECTMHRTIILKDIEKERYARLEESMDNNGGMLVHVHSATDITQEYLNFHWSILFLEQTWSIEHFFTINPTKIGIRFAEENQFLLNQFCKVSITKDTLLDLWTKLCSAIDLYETR